MTQPCKGKDACWTHLTTELCPWERMKKNLDVNQARWCTSIILAARKHRQVNFCEFEFKGSLLYIVSF